MKQPLINWKALMELSHPPRPPKGEERKTSIWDDSADMYDQMAKMEAEYTEEILSHLPISPEDSVLDIGCGPGRVAVPLARRAGRVTAIDSSEPMLAHCRENAGKAGVTNLEIRYLDWMEAVPGENLEKHDIVVASRSVGMYDLKKLSSFANKYAVTMCWANGPSIPELLDRLFEGTSDRPKMMPDDRRVSYNIQYNIAYDLGYEPNILVLPDGFRKTFSTREEAYTQLSRLRSLPTEKVDRFRENVDQFLTETPDGYRFEMKTRTYLMWWDVRSNLEG